MKRSCQSMRGKTRPPAIALAPLAAALLCAGVAGASAVSQAGALKHGRQRGSVVLSGTPGSTPAINFKTHTLYMPIQCQLSCNKANDNEHVLDLIDTKRCNAQVVSGCQVIGKAQAGRGPLWVAVDGQTDTLYVADAAGTVTVLDGSRCNASVRSGCRKPLATIKTGGFDVDDVLNPRTHTLYVAALSGDVFVIDVARCNSHTTEGCRQQVRKVKDKLGPDGIDVDLATDTVYVANAGSDGTGDTVWAINGAACNGTTGAGCGRKPHSVTVGSNPFTVTVDQKTDTVYAPSDNDGTVSVINGATCDGTVSSGCRRKQRIVPTGIGAAQVGVDQAVHTAFTLNQNDDTMSEFNTKTCNGQKDSGCPTIRARNERATFNPPVGYNPNGFALDPSTGTTYLVNGGGEPFLAAISIKRCNALTTAGCRKEAPGVARPVVFPTADPVTNTIYAANGDSPGIEVLNGATCNAHTRKSCAPVATIPFPHPQANIGSIDRATGTLYAADPYSNTVYAINIKHCNAHDTSGCSATAPKMTIGPSPGFPELDSATHTLYVPEGMSTSQGIVYDRVAVLDASTCNAKVTSGCGQTPGTITVGANTFEVAVSPSTDSVYAAAGGPSGDSRRVWVISGATCKASDHSGCSSAVVAKAKVGLGPSYVALNALTHTAYVPNNADGDLPGTVSVINTATCNGSVTSGCSGPFPTVSVGRSPVGVAVDTRTDRIYVGDASSAAISIIDGSRCNATHTSGCAGPAPEQPVGSNSDIAAVNDRTDTVYVSTHLVTRRLSIFGGLP